MKALVLKEYGDNPTITVENIDIPVPKQGEALVRIHAAPLYPFALKMATEGSPFMKELPLVLGNEGAGIVESGTTFPKGSRVMIFGDNLGRGKDGTYQEYIVVPESYLFRLPDDFSFEEGASFPSSYVTAYLALTRAGKIMGGEWIAVPGAAGSVGYAAIQISKALGAKPIAIVSSTEKAEKIKDATENHVVDLSKENLKDGIARITGDHGADLILDTIGGEMTNQLLLSVAPYGRVVSISFSAGNEANINLINLVIKQATLTGFNLWEYSNEAISESLAQLFKLAKQADIRPTIDSTFLLEEFEDAFERINSRKVVGKAVFKI
ncbi:NADPH:quinone oxidoreductase family protein [Bacillus sp. S/N-304-OC-R1]|uniref:quinone oxidoreductase family protein n=1 Tax=Bacillus sp. S/N-304-OC-R1 TaxID=2758034 RepID=UPI001C8E31DF|nr:NADPH:quinone oxidoreductase family protein [Bacillus sp. S/N-304-OC-R1]MBY0123592.1 NADPH:quinone oxidoreductase family protein [Bacillus sp. S/N-304-OC-R1]